MRSLIRVLSLALLLWVRAMPSDAQGPVITSAEQFTGLINFQCGLFEVLGPCSCTGLQVDQVCQLVRYYVPKFVVETVLIPGDSVFGGGLLSTATTALLNGFNPLEGSGGSEADVLPSGTSELFFRHAHVFEIPTIPIFGCDVCEDQSVTGEDQFTLRYLSEADPTWRLAYDGTPISAPFNLLSGAGVWGDLYPRSGFVVHPDQPVAAALAAWRALSVTFNPAPRPPGVASHVVINPAVGVKPSCFQVGYPSISRCGRAGLNPIYFDLEAVGDFGRNVFLFWQEKICCVAPSDTQCGLGVAVALGAIDNFCPIPYIPSVGIVPGMPPDLPFDGK